MKCPKCENENMEGAKFCAFCGSELKEEIKTRTCPICGKVHNANVAFCDNCGVRLNFNTTPKAAYVDNVQVVEVKPVSKQGFATAALICGIVSIAAIFMSGIFGIICAIAAIVFSIVALKKKQNKGKAITGMVFGIIGLLIGIIVVSIIIYLALNPELLEQIELMLEEWMSEYEEYEGSISEAIKFIR